MTEYAWDSGSCDPCPGPTLDPADLATFGADVITSTYKDIAAADFTLTRLHARYGKDVSNDLVFRAVEPLAGGRGMPDEHGAMSSDITRGASNNFQGRYVILHPWVGAIACASPVRGLWGGPTDQQQIAAKTATNLAFAPRGKVELGSMVSQVPMIGVLESKGTTLPLPIRQPQGCGCQAQGGAASALGLVVLGLVSRRRRR